MRMPTNHPAYEAPEWESDQEDDEENPYGAPFQGIENDEESIPDGAPLWELEPENYEENPIEAPFQELGPDEEYRSHLNGPVYFSYIALELIDGISQPPIAAQCPEDDSDAILDIPPPQHRGQLDPETLRYTQNATEDLRLEFRRLNMMINQFRKQPIYGELGQEPDSSVPLRAVLDRTTCLGLSPNYLPMLEEYSYYARGYGPFLREYDANDLFHNLQAWWPCCWLEARWLKEFFRTHNVPLTTEGDIAPESFNSVHLRQFIPDIYHPGFELSMSYQQVRSLVLAYLKRAAKRDTYRMLFIEKQMRMNPDLVIEYPERKPE